MLQFAKALPYLPDPRPLVVPEPGTAELVAGWQLWDTGSPFGWMLSYGYLTAVTVTADGKGGLVVENAAELTRETGQARTLDQFAPGHFGLACGYTLKTPAGLGSLILPAASPPDGLQAVTGIVETDWYPRQLFLVFRVPDAGRRVKLARGAELARLILVARDDDEDAAKVEGALDL
jgi:hypothetical protein